MAFVNENISDTDMNLYKLKEIDSVFRIGRASSRSWLADRQRGVYVRLLSIQRNHPEMTDSKDLQTWSIHVEGQVVFFVLEYMGAGKDGDGGVWNSWKFLGFETGTELPIGKTVFLSYLKEALTVYQFNGEFFSEAFYLKFAYNEA